MNKIKLKKIWNGLYHKLFYGVLRFICNTPYLGIGKIKKIESGFFMYKYRLLLKVDIYAQLVYIEFMVINLIFLTNNTLNCINLIKKR